MGDHAAVKLCHWLRESLVRGRPCYKEVFYGIESHRCLQMTPWLGCNQECRFCWRYPGWGGSPNLVDPHTMLDRAIDAQRALVSGYRGVPTVDDARWQESRVPNQMAISLSGEPTLYPYLGGLIAAADERGITTFLVTNGTRSDVLADLDPLPTQLYISVDAPSEEVYRQLCRPTTGSLWSRLIESLDTLNGLDTRTVVRHTLVRGWNMEDVEGYARLVRRADPDFVEAKGYVFVGHSRLTMSIDAMPSHEEVLQFSRALARATGYEVTAERPDSRVVLLTKDGRLPREYRPIGPVK